jgi:hypothetical protein
VAADDAGEAAEAVVARTSIGKTRRHGDPGAVGITVLMVVGHIAPVRLTGAVHRQPRSAPDTADVVWPVVEAKPTAAHFVESGDDDGVDEQFTEGLTMGCRPDEHAAQLSTPSGARQGRRPACQSALIDGARADLLLEVIDGIDAGGDLIRCQHAAHDQNSSQIEVVTLLVRHLPPHVSCLSLSET